jgi:hypothetical protein
MADPLRVYVGPEIRKYGIRYADAYNGSEQQLAAIKACGAIGSLFIPVEELPGHRDQLKLAGSKISQLSLNVIQWTKSLTPKVQPMPVKRRR